MFETDLKDGKRIEREFASRLLTWDLVSLEFSQGKCKDYDVKVVYNKGGREFTKTFEIKDDKVSPTSGNVGFEFRCNGVPSGIYASKSDYIVYHIHDTFYYADRGELIINLNDLPKTTVRGGDGDNSELYLVSNLYLDKLFKKL